MPDLIKFSADLVIELGSDRSHSRGVNCLFMTDFIDLALSIVLAIPMTVAPLRDKTLTVSSPRPELAPVTTIVLFWRSRDFVASSAVV